MAKLKQYFDDQTYESYRERYQECIRMLNGMEKTLERQLPSKERRWPEEDSGYRVQDSATESVPTPTEP